ncbi:hypothetical protein [Nocardioides bruguierae]|uniref:Uncharacterized protein n=1 Tax=Nocardioides bruguierae TaxID=2945102 RepID=A0A9X2DDJ0_9ACTN|nr:hypothetical protein [Nocardioides bruguierae]MCM0622499.1 hypothetical protein [Nocardioides bruguierae]
MPGMGPPPKPADQRARRNAGVAMTRLPASGRSGRTPKWPLPPDIGLAAKITGLEQELRGIEADLEACTISRERAALRKKRGRVETTLREAKALRTTLARSEKTLWAQLWKLPQATQWEKRGWFREVALFTRHQIKAEAGSLDDSKEARQREDRLGLNDQAMLRLRWEIIDDATPASAPTPRSSRNSSKYRDLKVVS